MTLLEFNKKVQEVAIKHFGKKCPVGATASTLYYANNNESYRIEYGCTIQPPKRQGYPEIISSYSYRQKEYGSPEEALETIEILAIECLNKEIKPSVDIEL